MKIKFTPFLGVAFGLAVEPTEREVYIILLCVGIEIKFRKKRKGGYYA